MDNFINNKKVLEMLPTLNPNGVEKSSSAKPFIEANTIEMSVKELNDQHIIPVWTTSNEPLISHSEFIESTWEIAHRIFHGETILKPNVRVSHPIKGRIPEAKHKSASELQPWEQTIYYERMMFVIEVPAIIENVNGNPLSLTIGGVKSYNLDNLYGKRSHGDQHFQIFIGFQNKVCCNLCVWSNGLKEELGIKSNSQLKYALENLYRNFNYEQQLKTMQSFTEVELSEREFAQVIGRARMYRHLPENSRQGIPEMLFGDQQLGTVVRDYYRDENFGNENGGNLSLWRLYNLLTGSNKSSYIDTFLDRSVNAYDVSLEITKHKANVKPCWYLG